MTRKYSDREVSLILQRALDPRYDADGPDAAGPGLTLEQVKEIAAEVGIDPVRIETAVASLTEPDPASPNPYVGIPTTVQFQTTLAGRELTERDLHDLLGAIRAVLGRHGRVGSEFGSLEWQARDALGGRYVSVVPSREGIRVRVLGNFRDGLFATLSGVGAAGALASVLLVGASGLGPIAPLVVAGSVLIPPPFVYRWWRRREDARLRRVLERIVALLSAPRQAAQAVPEQAAPEGSEP